ncbi:MAG: hypothetical protein BRD55_08430 [Bacteroidetes bacterium SW_9_63_38]|nr:MAG: hypothetical protein BRD55_08430 [Bacteroidetes bacterium SW_9_63_38]
MCGASALPQTSNSPLRLDHDLYVEAHADAVYHLLDHMQVDSLFLGGHSFGGLVALALLRRFPDLSVQGLALAACAPFPDPERPLLLQLAAVPLLGRAALLQLQRVRCAIEIPQAGAWSNSKLLSPEDRLKLPYGPPSALAPAFGCCTASR